jgi:hypothetical protein
MRPPNPSRTVLRPATMPLEACLLAAEGYHADARVRDDAARKPLSFPNELTRSDLILIGRALRSGWPIAPATLSRIAALVMRAGLSGRNDRLVNRGRSLMDEFPEAFRSAEPAAAK